MKRCGMLRRNTISKEMGRNFTFLSAFGLLQFIGTILEPLMRPLYRLPGYAGIDIATSITTSPAVDILI